MVCLYCGNRVSRGWRRGPRDFCSSAHELYYRQLYPKERPPLPRLARQRPPFAVLPGIDVEVAPKPFSCSATLSRASTFGTAQTSGGSAVATFQNSLSPVSGGPRDFVWRSWSSLAACRLGNDAIPAAPVELRVRARDRFYTRIMAGSSPLTPPAFNRPAAARAHQADSIEKRNAPPGVFQPAALAGIAANPVLGIEREKTAEVPYRDLSFGPRSFSCWTRRSYCTPRPVDLECGKRADWRASRRSELASPQLVTPVSASPALAKIPDAALVSSPKSRSAPLPEPAAGLRFTVAKRWPVDRMAASPLPATLKEDAVQPLDSLRFFCASLPETRSLPGARPAFQRQSIRDTRASFLDLPVSASPLDAPEVNCLENARRFANRSAIPWSLPLAAGAMQESAGKEPSFLQTPDTLATLPYPQPGFRTRHLALFDPQMASFIASIPAAVDAVTGRRFGNWASFLGLPPTEPVPPGFHGDAFRHKPSAPCAPIRIDIAPPLASAAMFPPRQSMLDSLSLQLTERVLNPQSIRSLARTRLPGACLKLLHASLRASSQAEPLTSRFRRTRSLWSREAGWKEPEQNASLRQDQPQVHLSPAVDESTDQFWTTAPPR
jgi:hypothetical protein